MANPSVFKSAVEKKDEELREKDEFPPFSSDSYRELQKVDEGRDFNESGFFDARTPGGGLGRGGTTEEALPPDAVPRKHKGDLGWADLDAPMATTSGKAPFVLKE